MKYKFKNKMLDDIWKNHPSKNKNIYYQQYEFFGDKILSFYLTLILFAMGLSHEKMSIYLSNMINNSTLAKIGTFLIKDISYSGKLTDSIVADSLEAWLACVFIDSNYSDENMKKIIKKLWKDMLVIKFEKNYKNQLQEIAQKEKKKLIYSYKKTPHGFFVECLFSSIITSAHGSSKKICSEKAAKDMINKLKSIN